MNWSTEMRALVQRVSRAKVTVGTRVTGEIGAGLLILVCAMQGDDAAAATALAARIAKLRIFRDPAGKMNLSLTDSGGAALVVSQFTLAGYAVAQFGVAHWLVAQIGAYTGYGVGQLVVSLPEVLK